MDPVSPISRGLNWQYLPRETSVERPNTGRYQTIPFHLRLNWHYLPWKQLLKDQAEVGNSKSQLK